MQIPKIDKNINTKVKDENIDNLIKSRKQLSLKNDEKPNKDYKIVQTNKNVIDKSLIKNNYQEKTTGNNITFRKIEFNYPEWKPNLEVSKQTKHLSESEKNLYESFIKEENDIKKDILINIDA